VNPPITTMEVAGRMLRDYFSTFFDIWGRTLDRAWEAMKEDFPNPVYMAITAIGLIFDVPFIPIQALLENFGRALIPNAAYYRRFVITGEQAFKMNVEFITRGTLRAGLIDQSLVDQGFTFIASRIFTMISGGGALSRIFKLAGLRTHADILRLLRGSLTRTVALRALSLMMVFFSLGYGVVLLLNMALTWPEVFEGLQQNNGRAWGRQRNRVRTATRTFSQGGTPAKAQPRAFTTAHGKTGRTPAPLRFKRRSVKLRRGPASRTVAPATLGFER
jgi:hypothetical protein